MNKILANALAMQVLEICSSSKSKDYVIYNYGNSKIEEEEAISGLEFIKEIMKEGLSPLTPIEFKNEIKLLIEHISKESTNTEILTYMITLLTKDDVDNLSPQIIDNIYKNSDYDSKILENFFKLGFDFEQGKFNEVDKALDKVVEFFELCLMYKKDFKFNYKYEEDLCLDEILKEDLDYLKSNCSDYVGEVKRGESLVSFLESLRKREELKDNLENSLNKKEESNNSHKI